MVGAGTYTEGAATKTYSLGDSGGSKDAVVVKHKHDDIRAFNGANWVASDVSSTGENQMRLHHSWDGTYRSRVLGTTETGVDGTDKNMQPYVVGKRWTRIA